MKIPNRLRFLIAPMPWMLLSAFGLLISAWPESEAAATVGFGVTIFAAVGICIAGWIYATELENKYK